MRSCGARHDDEENGNQRDHGWRPRTRPPGEEGLRPNTMFKHDLQPACPRALETTALLAGILSPGRESESRRHLETCQDCRARLGTGRPAQALASDPRHIPSGMLVAWTTNRHTLSPLERRFVSGHLHACPSCHREARNVLGRARARDGERGAISFGVRERRPLPVRDPWRAAAGRTLAGRAIPIRGWTLSQAWAIAASLLLIATAAQNTRMHAWPAWRPPAGPAQQAGFVDVGPDVTRPLPVNGVSNAGDSAPNVLWLRLPARNLPASASGVLCVQLLATNGAELARYQVAARTLRPGALLGLQLPGPRLAPSSYYIFVQVPGGKGGAPMGLGYPVGHRVDPR